MVHKREGRGISSRSWSTMIQSSGAGPLIRLKHKWNIRLLAAEANGRERIDVLQAVHLKKRDIVIVCFFFLLVTGPAGGNHTDSVHLVLPSSSEATRGHCVFFFPLLLGGRAIFSRRHVCCWCRCFWRWPCRRLRPGRRRRQQIDTKQLLSAVYIHGIAADGETCGGDLLRIRRSARRPSSARAPPSL